MFGLVLLLSVVARHRVIPGPGVCCDAGPVVRRDRPACVCNPGSTGLRTGARSQLADASCGSEFTPLTCMLLPSSVYRRRPQWLIHPQMCADGVAVSTTAR